MWPSIAASWPSEAKGKAAFIIKSGSTYETDSWCIYDEAGLWYTPNDPNQFYIEFFPYCEGKC
jgi:hypothetical protein